MQFRKMNSTASRGSPRLCIAFLLAFAIIGSSAQFAYNPQGYPTGYEVQPQPQKLVGYEAQDIIPPEGSPLKNLEQSQANRQYVDFINQLYRFDRTKPALNHRQNRRSVESSLNPVELNVNEASSPLRQKRAIIFRPLFVYRQQKVRKERLNEEEKRATAAVSANQSQLYKDKDNQLYREYNSYYDPYRYGQRYPYRSY